MLISEPVVFDFLTTKCPQHRQDHPDDTPLLSISCLPTQIHQITRPFDYPKMSASLSEEPWHNLLRELMYLLAFPKSIKFYNTVIVAEAN